MRLATLLRPRAGDRPPGVAGTARLDRRTKLLARRLRPGDIAIINHVDLDRAGAEALLERRVAAVVNVAPSISGRYPNLGPELLVAADVALLDVTDGDLFACVRDGDKVRVHDDAVYAADGRVLATGTPQTRETVAKATAAAHAGLAVQLEAFAANAIEYLKREHELLLDGVGVPQIRTQLDGRHVLVVARGHDCRRDLRALRAYIREQRPVLIGVDAGADALLEQGLRPDLIVGDVDAVSDAALRCGAEIVVRADPDRAGVALARVHELDVEAVPFPAAGTSADAALLLADDGGAALIVTVGTHASLVELLDKGRAGMASTFLTRLRVGGKLVDAKAVSRLYRHRVPNWALVMLVVAAFATLAVALSVAADGHSYHEILSTRWHEFLHWLQGLR